MSVDFYATLHYPLRQNYFQNFGIKTRIRFAFEVLGVYYKSVGEEDTTNTGDLIMQHRNFTQLYHYYLKTLLDAERAYVASRIVDRSSMKGLLNIDPTEVCGYIIWVGELVRKWPSSWVVAFRENGYSWEGIKLPA